MAPETAWNGPGILMVDFESLKDFAELPENFEPAYVVAGKVCRTEQTLSSVIKPFRTQL